MGFVDENNNPLINEEQKVRIKLSNRAKIIMAEDMDIFGIDKSASFINTVFSNFKTDAKSSIFLYLEQRELELNQIFSNSKLDEMSKEICIQQIIAAEKEEIAKKIEEYKSYDGDSKLYHINDSNVKYLVEDCHEEKYYKRPALYVRSVIEEYCSLPFIKRIRIFRKDVYDLIERACLEKRILKIKALRYQKEETYYVYPYKIVSDPLHTQSYLVCYSRNEKESEDKKVIASFTMSKVNTPTMLKKTYYLNNLEIDNIELQLSKYSPAYFLENPEQVKVKLTKNGKRAYQSRLYSRPEKIDSLSTDDVYVFDCTKQQIFNYFFPFGADAEVISPESLRKRFQTTHEKALNKYKK